MAFSWHFVDNRFSEDYKATIGADLLSKSMDIGKYKNVTLFEKMRNFDEKASVSKGNS